MLNELQQDTPPPPEGQGNSVASTPSVSTMPHHSLRMKASKAKAEEASKARILFVIVALFFVCNVPRTILNLEELIAQLRHYLWPGPCSQYKPPFWTLILNSFSQVFLNVNGSLVSVIYCVMCKTFRMEVKQRFFQS